jgi:hypothetical protein
MSFLSDIFGGGDINNATNDQINGLIQGTLAAEGPLNANAGVIEQYGGQALQPYQTNFNTAQGGVGALGNLLGLNGPAGSQSALTQLQTTPGYQFTKGQGEGAINAAAAAGGTLNSGNQLTALSNYDTGLAQNTYQGAVSNLAPYLGLASSSAGGIASVNQNEASGLVNNNNQLASLLQGTFVGAGNAGASGQLAQQASGQGLLGGLLSLGGSALGGLGGLGGIGASLGGGLGSIGGGGSGVGSIFGNLNSDSFNSFGDAFG